MGTIVERGYLETEPYLSTYPYLTTGQIDDTTGIQFKAVITNQNQRGAQFKGLIAEQTPTGVQFQGKITKLDAKGLQFNAINTKQDSEGVQFQAFADGQDSEGVQFRGVVASSLTRGVQFNGINTKSDSEGVQFNALADGLNQRGISFRASNFLHVPCGDGLYLLNEPYLSAQPYLVAEYCAFMGVQFRAGVTAVQNTGVQFKGIISEQTQTGVQFQGKIESEKTTGAQFRALNIKQDARGTQFNGVIKALKTTGVQFKGLITSQVPKGVQFTSVKLTFTGAQFRVILYNTTQVRVLCDFPSRGDGTSWTVQSGGTRTSSTNAFDVNNLNTDIVEQAYRSVTTANVQLICDTNVPQGVFVDTLALLNHNLTRGANVTFEGSNDPGFGTSVSVSVPVTTTNAYWISPDAPLAAYRYWRVTMQDSTNPDGFLQVGTVVFGASEIFSKVENFVDRVVFGQKQFVDKVFTEGHTNVTNDRGKKKFITLDFRNLVYQRTNWNILSSLFDQYGITHKCLWIPTPEVPQRFAVFGKLNEIPQEEHNYKGQDADYVAVSLTIDEAL